MDKFRILGYITLKVGISLTFNNADVCKVKGELALCFEFDKPCKAMQSSTKYADLTNALLHKVHSWTKGLTVSF